MRREVLMMKSRGVEICWNALSMPSLHRQARRGHVVGVDTEQRICWLGGQHERNTIERFLDIDAAHFSNQMDVFISEGAAIDPTFRNTVSPTPHSQTRKRGYPGKVSTR